MTALSGAVEAQNSDRYTRQLEQRIDQLRLENSQLWRENQELKQRWQRYQQQRSYGYGQSPVQQSAQRLRELEQLRRSIDNLRR